MKLAAVVRAARRLARRHVPAAHDNRQGTNASDLWTCRRILRQLLIDPDIARPINDYLRNTGEENPQP